MRDETNAPAPGAAAAAARICGQPVANLFAMPAASPSYPPGPYRFVGREYMVVTYETDPSAVREALPEPLEPEERPLVRYEWMKMLDGHGFGSSTESGLLVPCRFRGAAMNYVVHMYLDDDPPIAAGREIWGFPSKYAEPRLAVVHDTLTGTLTYAGQLVAMGTMTYKHERLDGDGSRAVAALSTPRVSLKLIPGADGTPAICQLVACELAEIAVKGSWAGAARLHLVPHVNAPVADFPVRRIVAAEHLLADVTLPYGRVLHDYAETV